MTGRGLFIGVVTGDEVTGRIRVTLTRLVIQLSWLMRASPFLLGQEGGCHMGILFPCFREDG